jgi:hypothetical protein
MTWRATPGRPWVQITDHAEISADGCRVVGNRGNGLLVERGALTWLERTAVLDNGLEAGTLNPKP